MSGLVKVVLLVLAVGSLLESAMSLEAFENPLPSHVMMPVHLGSDESRVKRQTSGPVVMNQPLRILPIYSDTFANDLGNKLSLIQDTIIPKVLGFLQQSFSVAPLPGPILLNNMCTGTTIMRNTTTGAITCPDRCATTMCGTFRVPTEHLKQCRECSNNGPLRCGVGSPVQDGPGISDYEFVLYVTADQSRCPTAQGGGNTRTVAFALACQSEALQDRPIAGNMNFCPESVGSGDSDFAFAVTKHEILHALGFSSSQYPLWRDPDTNLPRTPRDPDSGLPPVDEQTRTFDISPDTLERITYSDWFTTSGNVQHEVIRLVTPAIRAEGRRHFDCPTLRGVELENQGGPGTQLEHWEKRLLGNEAMTGQVTFNPVFSRFTFALFEDSGWYSVNYNLADELIWGQGAGCRFAEGSCGEWLATRQNGGQPLAPFCNVRQDSDPIRLSCTPDHEAVSRCNLVDYTTSVPTEYQYFDNNPNVGGSFQIADFCPVQDVFTIRFSSVVVGTTCSIGENQPPGDSNLLESYGNSSRCVRHGSRQWTVNGASVKYGGGCYRYSCSGNSVTITIASNNYVCSCSQANQEMEVDLRVGGRRYQGSILCPECSRICHTPSQSIVIGASGGIERTTSSARAQFSPSSALLLLTLTAAILTTTALRSLNWLL